MSAAKPSPFANIKNRLLAATAAFALALARVSPSYAGLPSPAIQTPAANDNSVTAANTAFVTNAIAALRALLLGATVNKAGDTMTGPFSLTATDTGITDIHTAPPINGAFINPNGTYFDYCSVSGCLPGPHLLGQEVLFSKTHADASAQETGLAINMTSATGAALYWTAGTAYSVGTQVHAGSGQDIYQVTVAGTSASSGLGPNFCPGGGTSTPSPQCSSPASETNASTGTDGTVTWSFVGAGINDGKSGMSIGFVMNPGSGHSWAMDTSIVANSGAGKVPFFGYEDDTSNSTGYNYDIGGPIALSLFINGYNANRMTAAIGVFTGGSAANKAFQDGILFNGDNQILADTFADATSSANVIHGLGSPHTHTNFIFDQSTDTTGINLSGTYTGSSIIDTTGASGAALNALQISVDKQITWVGGATTASELYSSAVGGFARTINGTNVEVLSSTQLTALVPIAAPALATSPPSGSVKGTVCSDGSGVFYVKTTPGSCL